MDELPASSLVNSATANFLAHNDTAAIDETKLRYLSSPLSTTKLTAFELTAQYI